MIIEAIRVMKDRNFPKIDHEPPFMRARRVYSKKSKKIERQEYPSLAPTDYRFFTAEVDISVDNEKVTLRAQLFDALVIDAIFIGYMEKLDISGGRILPSFRWSEHITTFLAYYSDSSALDIWQDGYIGPLLRKNSTEVLDIDGDLHMIVVKRNEDSSLDFRIIKIDGEQVYRRRLVSYKNPKNNKFMWYWIENNFQNTEIKILI